MVGKEKQRESGEARREREILFLPGLGMDRDMYLPLLREMLYSGISFRPTFAVNTPMLHPRESLASFTDRIFYDQELGRRRYDLVVAQSMGGMMAQQALESGLLQCDHLLLISTAFSGEDLTLFSRWFAMWAHLTPRFLRRLLRDLLGILYPFFRFTNPWGALMGPMWRRANPDLLFYAPRMVREWRRGLSPKDTISLPDFARTVHGTGDWILSFRRVQARRAFDTVIRRGSHVIFSTHAGVISGIMDRLLREGSESGTPKRRQDRKGAAGKEQSGTVRAGRKKGGSKQRSGGKN